MHAFLTKSGSFEYSCKGLNPERYYCTSLVVSLTIPLSQWSAPGDLQTYMPTGKILLQFPEYFFHPCGAVQVVQSRWCRPGGTLVAVRPGGTSLEVEWFRYRGAGLVSPSRWCILEDAVLVLLQSKYSTVWRWNSWIILRVDSELTQSLPQAESTLRPGFLHYLWTPA
jgi:hypothetical protein